MQKNYSNLKNIAAFVSDKNFPSLPIDSFFVDSRHVEKGGMFFALLGARVNGHTFLSEAAQRGAVAAVVQHTYEGPDHGLILIKVHDPLQALQNMAHRLLIQRGTRVVGITGSVGKTTTKDFAFQLLRQTYKVAASPGNSNSQIGLPLSILNSEGNEDILVLEMGMTEANHIKKLVQIAPPEVAVITKTALVHAENFSSLEAIGFAKAEIFSHPATALGILCREAVNYEKLCQIGICQKISFSIENKEADLIGVKKNNNLLVSYHNHTVNLPPLPVKGEHNFHNFLAAVAIAKYFKVDWQKIQHAISHLYLPERRFQIIEKKGILFVNDSYNASEVSVKAALKSLPTPSFHGKKIAIIGEMLELGKFSEACHKEVGEYALEHVSHMICFGEECKIIYEVWRNKNRPVDFVITFEQVMVKLKSIVKPGDVVLLKGSKLKELWKVLDEI